MKDPRVRKLADLLVRHSCKVQSGDNVLIEAFDLPSTEVVCDLIELVAGSGAHPFVIWKDNKILSSLYANASSENLAMAGQFERSMMEKMNAYIGIRGASNSSQFSNVPQEKMEQYQKEWWNPVHTEVRVPKTKWVVLRYPTDAFEDFYFDVCTADYAAMAKAQQPLVELMEKTDRVRIVGPGTDLSFSIKDIPVIPCAGEHNIPDGEVFTAPVKESVNGTITYNTKSRYQGTVYENICFEFKDGKIVNATANETKRINQVLDSDEGARYIGEWSIGCNNRVRHPMLDTLFDEKIGGSLHLTPGQAYEVADNGNRSCVHWDLVLIQRSDYGGGEIYFDDQLIRKNGAFVFSELQGLNEGL